jgi:hypothetical protein
MPVEDLERDFPSLNLSNYEIISPEDFNYNGLAFVLGDSNNWWEPPGILGHYWPDGFAETVYVETAGAIVQLHGYTLDTTSTTEADAVAIYAISGEWTHLARSQDGRWVSKLGEGHDIIHSTPDVLEGDLFGRVVRVLANRGQPIKPPGSI